MRALGRLTKYALFRGATLMAMVVISVFLTIFIANLGGYIDVVIRANIDESIGMMTKGGWLRDVTDEAERMKIIDETRAAMVEGAGLNQPFILRTARHLWNGLTLDWGPSQTGIFINGVPNNEVRNVILDYLPRTLLVFGTANLLMLIGSIALALTLTQRYGGWLDKLVTAFSPMAAAPSWVYGIILSAILIKVWNFNPGNFRDWPREFNISQVSLYAKYMLPAVIAIFLSKFAQSVYSWRTFFLINANEDYVEMAKARGVSPAILEQQYILRPSLPNIFTSFALLMVSLWQEVILLEQIFSIQGIGKLFFISIQTNDIRTIVGLVVTFAYLLAITIFLLDLCYAIADPRIQIGNQNHTLRIARRFNTKEWIISLRTPRIKQNNVVPRKLALAPVAANHKDPTIHQVEPALPIQKRIIDGIYKIAQMWKYPPIVIGGLILAILVEISIFTMLILPYNQAVKLWQAKQTDWYRYPKNALPAWINAFRKEDLPSTIILNSINGGVIKEFKEIKEDFYQVDLTYNFDYPYSGGFPQDVDLLINTQYKEKRPHLTLTWTTPDGREIDLGSVSVVNGQSYRLFLEESIQKKLKDKLVARSLFGALDPNQPVRKAIRDDGFSAADKPVTGPYRLHIKGYLFEKDAKLDAELLIYGQVYGVAGTDNKRRDLLIGLLWGTPIALAFGIVAAMGTSLSTMLFAAVSTWFGGWVDEFIQRLTEINMLIPFYPICLMIYVLYSKSFLVILGVAVALSIFGSGIKNYRAVFLQIREEPFIEAARTYGASDWRIIFKYLIPRIRTVLVPQLIYLVPSYVFLEASLAVLGLSDPKIPPTWGQLVVSGLGTGLYYEGYYLSLIPAVLLILTGVAFLLIGKSLEQIFEPRLREM